jgi:hypothetical protein
MGVALTQNAATFATGELASKPMSTVAFAALAGPWIYYTGNIAIALGNFLFDLNYFLQAVASSLI